VDGEDFGSVMSSLVVGKFLAGIGSDDVKPLRILDHTGVLIIVKEYRQAGLPQELAALQVRGAREQNQ
jgi:hypothetical protein